MNFNGFVTLNDASGDVNLLAGTSYVADLADPDHTYTLPKATPDNRGRVIEIQPIGLNLPTLATASGDTRSPEALAGNQWSAGVTLWLISDGDHTWTQRMMLTGGPPAST